ncbi:MAG: aldose epimerase family protein [Acidimicrobiia bacterium]
MTRSESSKRPAAAIRSWHGAAAAVLNAGDCEAVVLPSLGMLVPSFTHRGDELVALPGGLGASRAGHTTGIPLLYPWANRLARDRYRAGDVEVDLRGLHLHTDDNGLPIHGVMLARPEWEVTRLGAGPRSARLAARFDWGAHEDLMAVFPFPHELAVDVTLAASGLRIVTSVRPNGPMSVPVAFGWHPYLRLPGATRNHWDLALPERAHAALDGRGIPTGRARPSPAETAPLAGRDLDELFALGPDRILSLATTDRRLTVTYDDGYPYAQVYAPEGKPFCAIEPMTAPTNALVTGDHPSVRPGETFSAAFTLSVAAPSRKKQPGV